MNTKMDARQEKEDEKYVKRPVVIVTAVLIVITGCLVYFGIKNRAVVLCVRDLVITVCALLLFLVGAVLAFLCFYLSSRIDDAKIAVDGALKSADGKIEELAEKITDILKKILEPFIGVKSSGAGIMQLFRKNKSEN